MQDIQRKMGKGPPPLFYHHIPYMPVYAAAGDEIQFGFVLADGQVGFSSLASSHFPII